MGGQYSQPSKIAVIGVGAVGATLAYALLINGSAEEIILLDTNQDRVMGEVMDLNHAIPFANPVKIKAGSLDDCAGAQVVVFTAGAKQRPRETRLDLLKRNADMFHQIVPKVAAVAPEAIFLIATNPVDILSYVAWRESGFPKERVIGSGTILDTARLRYLLGEKYKVDPRSVHAYVIGEHGDSELAVWSSATIGGVKLSNFPDLAESSGDIFCRVKNAAYEIIQRKGATYYAIGLGLKRIIESIINNQNSVMSVSVHVDGLYGISDVYLGLPAIIGREGIQGILPLQLDTWEEQALRLSADLLKRAIKKLYTKDEKD
ncbi:MAG: L-lactate dehydrogenase [Bacillota bacterium]